MYQSRQAVSLVRKLQKVKLMSSCSESLRIRVPSRDSLVEGASKSGQRRLHERHGKQKDAAVVGVVEVSPWRVACVQTLAGTPDVQYSAATIWLTCLVLSSGQ